MLSIIIPVILTLLFGPGIGQLYNKEYRKGLILVALSLGLLVAFSIWLGRAAMNYLPADLNAVDRTMLRNVIQDHIMQDHAVTFYTYEVLLAVLWVYGVVDAYLGASRRRLPQS